MFSSKKLQVRDYETDEVLPGAPSDDLVKLSTDQAGDGAVAAELIDGVWQYSERGPEIRDGKVIDHRRAIYVSDRVLKEGEPHFPGGK